MLRTSLFSFLTAAALLAGTEFAQAAKASEPAVVVHVAGRPTRAVHSDIVAAARKVCNESHTDVASYDSSSDECVLDTVTYAMRQLASVDTAYVVAAR